MKDRGRDGGSGEAGGRGLERRGRGKRDGGGIDHRHKTLLMVSWGVIALCVVVIMAMQFAGRYGGDALRAPSEPSAVGSMQMELVSRHGIGTGELGEMPGLGMLGGERARGQILDQLDAMAGDNPVQAIRASKVALYLSADDPSVARSLLDRAEGVIAGLDEERRNEWRDLGYVEDIGAMRVVVDRGPEGLDAAAVTRLRDRYPGFVDYALSARAGDDDPVRARLDGDGLHTSIALISVVVLVGVCFLVGMGLFVTGCVLAGTGRLRWRYVETVDRDGDVPGVTLEMFALFLVGFLVVQFVGGLVIGVLSAWGVSVPGGGMAVMLPLLWGLLGILAWSMVRNAEAGWGRRALGLHRGGGLLREVGAGVVGYLAGLPIVAAGLLLTIALMSLATLLGLDSDAAHPAPDMISGGDVWATALVLILGVVWAPVVEEIFFRGALFHHLRRSHGFLLSACFTGFLFAVIHPQGLLGVPVLMSIGVVFAMIREWRGSIIGPIVAHAINNGFVFGMLLVVLA